MALNEFVQTALDEEGYEEGSDGYTKYGSWYGLANADWCVMFISWCANQAGIMTTSSTGTVPNVPKMASTSAMYTWYTNNRRNLAPSMSASSPNRLQVGDIVVINTQNGGPVTDHVGIVVSVDYGNVEKCAVGKYPKSEKHGNTAQFSEVERSGTQENCGGIGSSCRLRLRPLPVLRRRQSQRVARIDPNAVVVGKNIAENDRFDLFSRQLVRRDLVDLLFLERGKKALHPCVVEAMSGAAEALYHAAARQLGTKS